MSILKKLKSDKKKLGLLVSIIIILIGVIPLIIFIYIPDLENPYKIESLTLTSEDGTRLNALKYTPKGEKNHGGIVVGHGYCGNVQHMQPLSIELVKRGFTVINLDFRGHGASEGFLLRSELINDVKAAVDYLEYNISYVSEIGLVGHSMGGGAVLAFSKTYPSRVNATVAIGAVPDEREDMLNVSNLLLAIGLFEQGATREDLLNALRLYKGRSNVTIGELLDGDFIGGNNTKGFISPFSEHIFEVKDTAIIYETVQWFEQAFNGVRANDIVITSTYIQIFSYISLFGVVTLSFIVIVYLSNYLFKRKTVYPEKEILKGAGDISIYKLIAYYSILVVLVEITFMLFLPGEFFSGIIPLSGFDGTLPLIIGAAIGTIIIYYFLIMRREESHSIKDFPLKIKEMSSTNSRNSIIHGILSALILIYSIAAVWHWSVQNTLPSIREYGTILGITLVLFPFILTKEFYFRNVQGKLTTKNKFKEYFTMVGIGIFMETFLLGIILLISWLRLASLPVPTLYLSVWVAFLIIQQFAVNWVYLWSGRNILGSTIFLCIFYAWISVSFFPYGFL